MYNLMLMLVEENRDHNLKLNVDWLVNELGGKIVEDETMMEYSHAKYIPYPFRFEIAVIPGLKDDQRRIAVVYALAKAMHNISYKKYYEDLVNKDIQEMLVPASLFRKVFNTSYVQDAGYDMRKVADTFGVTVSYAVQIARELRLLN